MMIKKSFKGKKVIVIGAGPGGLATAMLLAYRGYEVKVYEKQPYIGGRNSALKIGDFIFDLGPTFVMLPQVFEEIFALAGRKFSDYVGWQRLDTLYRLNFGPGNDFVMSFDKEKVKEEIKKIFPGDESGYERYLAAQKIKFGLMYPCLKIPYLKWYSYLNKKLVRAFPLMDNFISVYDVMAKYFNHEQMRLAMTFQAKYLGMSPWACPGAFSILSYVEHAYGIFHPLGGVYKISEALARVTKEEGGEIFLKKAVKKILTEKNSVSGVEFEDGEREMADFVVMNADFPAGITKLVPEDFRGKWRAEKLEKKSYSCSTFMLYLGLNKKYDFAHHNIFFAQDYKKNVAEIFSEKILPQDPSFYIQNACVTDRNLAPAGKSTIYILVPAANLQTPVNWDKEKNNYRDLIIKKIKERTEMADIEEHIEMEKIITPADWENEIGVFKGAVFNLAHTIGQMLYLRPHNEFSNLPGLYLAGGGTHPGSGLPTIVESGRITADLIDQKLKK